MAGMPGVVGRRYLPFFAVAAALLLLVVIAPSRAPGSGGSQSNVAAGGNGLGGAPGTAEGNGVTGAGGATGGVGGAGTVNAGPGGINGAAGGASGIGGAAGATGPVDLSKCDPKTGKELGPTYYMPRCVPVWHGGNNGGATMNGVFPDHINVVLYNAQGNAQVNAILSLEGLADSQEGTCEANAAFNDEVNKRWEFYGRKMVSLDGPGKNKGSAMQSPCHWPYFQGQCSLTPPDPPCERAEADVIAAMKPAYVIAPVADPAFYQELAKKHVIVAGGGSTAPVPNVYFQDDDPYYYDVTMDSTRATNMLGEYWCKKLNDKPVKFAGPDVATTRNWGPAPGVHPTRKAAILFPATNGDPTQRLGAENFVANITGRMCDSPGGVLELPYQSDINTAQQQSQTIVNELIANHITSVVCFCDLIAPVFFTTTMKNNGYFPEHVLSGTALIDYDTVGKLYDPTEWSHAFGLSQLPEYPSVDKQDQSRAFNDAGRAGVPNNSEGLPWAYWALAATSFQEAGPIVTPQTMHQALLNAPGAGGWALTRDPHYPLVKMQAPDSWTFIQDMREVYWNTTRSSTVNNQPGSYCPVGGGIRYTLGQWPGGDPDVFDPAHNGC